MTKQEQYIRNKPKLLNDKSICKSNRDLFKVYLDRKELRLAKKKNLPKLTETQYKTLCQNISSLKNINLWFNNKPLKKITKEDLENVCEGLREEKLKGINGHIVKTRQDYYDKFFKSLLFEMAGKKDIAKEVLEDYGSPEQEEVRFFDEKTHEAIKSATKMFTHRLLCQLSWDIGENIFTMLQLQKHNFLRQINPKTNEVEYIINLPKEKIKSSRTARSEITNFEETAKLLDIHLNTLKDDDYLFNFGHRQALKFLKEAVNKVNAKCIPKGQPVTWKDYRSSMACYLLDLDWTTDEIKARLGHKPSSRVLDKYVSYKAIKRHTAKDKADIGKLSQLKEEIKNINEQNRLKDRRIEKLTIDIQRTLEENKYFYHWVKIFSDLYAGEISQEEATQKMKALAIATNTNLYNGKLQAG